MGAAFWLRQTEEAPRFGGNVVEVGEATSLANYIEEIAMLGRCPVGPFADPGAIQSNIQ